MKQPSERAYWLVDQLFKIDRQPNWLGRQRRRSDAAARLAELSACREVATVPCLCRFLLSGDQSVRAAAQNAVRDVLSALAPLELLQLSDAFGWQYGWYVGDAWQKLSPSDVDGLAIVDGGKTSVSILGLLSFHRNGYVRKKAVKRLAQLTNGLELPFLLIRQNDWVKPVSSVARAAVRRRLKSDYIKHFAENISLVAHLPEFSRHDVSAITDAVFTQLLDLKNDDALRSLIQTGERVTVRRFVKRGFELPGDHHGRLARYGVESGDVVVRLRSARQLLAEVCDGDLEERLLNDVFAPVRRIAIEAKTERAPDSAIEVWKRALLDRNAGIRELGRYHLTKLAAIDVREFYRSELSANPENVSALAELSVCATEDDVPLLRDYTQHKLPSRRRFAIAGLARVLGARSADELLERLTDDSPSVTRQAARFLEDFANDIDGSRLFNALVRSQNDAGRRATLRLIYELGKWKSLPWLIRAAGLENELLREQASAYAYSWLISNRVFTNPSGLETNAIMQAYHEVARDVPSTLRDQLREYLPFSVEEKAMSRGNGDN